MPFLIRFTALLSFIILSMHFDAKQIKKEPLQREHDAIIQQAASKQTKKKININEKPKQIVANKIEKTEYGNETQDIIIKQEQANFKQLDDTKQSKPIHTKATKKQTRTVQVSNNITQKMLGYKYIIDYYPSKFILTINDTPIEQNQTENIVINDNKITVRYEYEFLYGMRKGAKITTFDIEPKADHLNITFSWNNEWRVIIGKATPLEATRITL